MIIVDASVVMKWFVDEPLHPQARHIYEYQLDIQAPDFILVEVANIVWKKTMLRNEIESEQARQIVGLVAEAIPVLIPTSGVLRQATEIAIELVHPVYDCLYLACLEEQHDLFVTGDRRLFNKTRSTRYRDKVRFIDDPDLGLPLYIPLHKVEEIIRLSNLIDDTHRNLISIWKGEKSFVFHSVSELQPLFDSPAYHRLNDALTKLSVDEQADILALGWLGRGTEGDEWTPLRAHAKAMIEGNDRRFLGYVGSRAIYVEQGLAILRSAPCPPTPNCR